VFVATALSGGQKARRNGAGAAGLDSGLIARSLLEEPEID
jgi:hypothetical protein